MSSSPSETDTDQTTETPAEALSRMVHEAVGAASTCWENLEGTGVFQDDRAREVAERLLNQIHSLAPALTRQPYLGYATTIDLINELQTRANVSLTIGEDWPKYRTADS